MIWGRVRGREIGALDFVGGFEAGSRWSLPLLMNLRFIDRLIAFVVSSSFGTFSN